MEVVWLSDGVDLGRGAEFVTGLARAAEGRAVTVVDRRPADRACARRRRQCRRRAHREGAARRDRRHRGRHRSARSTSRACRSAKRRFAFKDGERETEAEIDLPVEIRNDIARLEIAGERSAGAVQLLDKRWRRRTVGVVSGSTADTAQPLLASTYYLSRALNPFADVRLAERGVARRGGAPFHRAERADDHPRRRRQCRGRGARPARRAGSRTAACWCASPARASPASDDDLVPVKLRRGGRTLGGSLSWDQPQPLAAFSRESPFGGMAVPNDVTVTPPGAGRAGRRARPSAPGRRSPTARRWSPPPSAARA